MKIDFLIVGQGLAGSLLAWHLLEKGQRILVVDRDEPNTSSKIAAGLITPVYGSKFKTAGNLPSTLPYARKFYWDLEEKLGTVFYHHKRIARLFQNHEDKALWLKRLEGSSDQLKAYHEELSVDEGLINAPFGGFEMKGGGWLDLPAFLEQTRQHLLEHAAYAISKVDSEEIIADGLKVKWKNITAGKVVFCQGWRGHRNRFFDWIPMNPAKGEILEFQCEELSRESRILNSGGWILPTLKSGTFRSGSTYDHDATNANPTDTGRKTIQEKISRMVRPPVSITKHFAAYRPTIRQSTVAMGTHPGFQRVTFFNGLGSKGVLNGPYFANQMAEHLVQGTEIEGSVDIRRNF